MKRVFIHMTIKKYSIFNPKKYRRRDIHDFCIEKMSGYEDSAHEHDNTNNQDQNQRSMENERDMLPGQIKSLGNKNIIHAHKNKNIEELIQRSLDNEIYMLPE